MELKSFLLSKFYIDPVHCVLMSSPLFLLVPCKTWFGPSAACPAKPSNLEIISMTFAAVICDADDPCSVNTA